MRRLVVITGNKVWSFAAIVVVCIMVFLVLSVAWQGTEVVGSLKEVHTVVLDPGHGGYDPGATTKQGVYEKEINLQIAEKVVAQLKPTGVRVLLTRDEDEDYASGVKGKGTKKQTDLNYRIALAGKSHADIFVSLHVNAAAGNAKSGAETFYHYKSEEGKKLAGAIQRELVKIAGMNKRIAKPGDFYIIKNTSMPAVIVELGYLTNTAELKKLRQPWYQEQLATAVAKGIAKYFGYA